MPEPVEEFWRTASQALHHFIRARVADEQTADDILQDVLVRALTQIHTVRDETKLAAWLFQIARHTIIDHYRRAKPGEELDESIAAFAEAEEDLEHALAECLPGYVELLPPSYRDALKLSELQGLPQKQVAQKLGLSLSGAKSRVQRGREKIRAMLEACCEFQFDRLGKIIDYRPKCDPQTCDYRAACC